MMDLRRINRRQFIGASVAAGLAVNASNASYAQGQKSASDRITVGMIGVGARAHQLLEAIQATPGTEVVGVCDAYKGRLERAVERTHGRAKIYKDYREILADGSIDSVFVATPDHWHKTMAIEAVQARKDVYIEKPLTYAIEEGPVIIAEVAKANRILQVGSQGISSTIQQKAKEIIKSGKLGQITMIRASYNRNSASGAWIYPIPPDASAQTVDWDRFLGSAPKRPYDPARFFRWRCYWDYSGGNSTDLFVHLMTTIHFLMDAKAPQTTVANGALYRWKESRDVPDTINAILDYPEGFMVTLSSTFNNQGSSEGGFQILGSEGTLVLSDNSVTFEPENVHEDNRWIVESWPSALEGAYYKDPKVLKSEVPSSWESRVSAGIERWDEEGKDSTLMHVAQFFDCVRSRKEPVENALIGHRAAAVAHLVNLSYKQKRMVHWDFAREMVKV
jgi:predicted dehydrogenase